MMRPALQLRLSSISSTSSTLHPRHQILSTFHIRSGQKQTRTYIVTPASASPDLRSASAAKHPEQFDRERGDVHVGRYRRQINGAIGQGKNLQTQAPWHRQRRDEPPVKGMKSTSAMTKGKLLTTPSRLLKLVLPLTIINNGSDRKDIEPLALLVHPQQPLSYLERLIQYEVPMIKGKDGKEKAPQVHFRAEDGSKDDVLVDGKEDGLARDNEGTEETIVEGKLVKLGKIRCKEKDHKRELTKEEEVERGLRGGPGEGGVESYSGRGREGASTVAKQNFVRWSSSTEIGDFIRDAARASEFAVEIEGSSEEIRVGVPSFNDRTHYLRVRLRKTSRKLADLASVKKECDLLAHKSAQRLAMGGFGVLGAWWAAIYHFTFQTDYGWDTMEPVTYLAGLSTIMLGYLWFLYHNREVSYRAALNLTVSRRQNALYHAKGLDVQKWDQLIEEANSLRKEIKIISNEYDVEWDEKADEGSEDVHDALKEERIKRGRKSKAGSDDESDEKEIGEDSKKKSGKNDV